ncbi:uncharacterized protein CTRU02_211124 [Colletotrichum truncatum]|uniref:Uncharacterized protein n=1 Tax=Colletotrichum truncatum TaxID=5467 RepID=A0ACC3YQY2_COLTU|nr:uncharacterized protein CTRU02_01903 [Colletotrichum truncatum]KAF6799032.1 hypothetical protein CTRU02_01903 [Colletotrichum truncatum]
MPPSPPFLFGYYKRSLIHGFHIIHFEFPDVLFTTVAIRCIPLPPL